MNNIELYEKIPKEKNLVRLLDYKNIPFLFPLHWHENTELHFLFDGKATLRCGENIISLSKGDCVIVNRNELHEGLGSNCSYGCIILPPSFFDENYIIFQRCIKDSYVSELVNKIFDSYRSNTSYSSLEIKGYTYLLVVYLIQNYTQENLSEDRYRSHFEKLAKINKAIKYINENYTENITTSYLAKMVHLSEGHFCHLFKEVTEKTAKEYILSLRIEKAEGLLRTTEMTVTEVCCYCGFSDPNYFTRIYKKITGELPSKVKKSGKKYESATKNR